MKTRAEILAGIKELHDRFDDLGSTIIHIPPAPAGEPPWTREELESALGSTRIGALFGTFGPRTP